VTPEAKRAFAGPIALDLPGADGTTTVAGAANRAAQSLARAFQSGQTNDLVMPTPPSALELAGLDAPLA
jgi:CRISPR-associated protein Cas1